MRISIIQIPPFPLYKKPLLQAIKIWKKVGISFDTLALSTALEARQTATLIRKKCLVKTKPQVWEVFLDTESLIGRIKNESPDAHLALICNADERRNLLNAFQIFPEFYDLNPTGWLMIELNLNLLKGQITALLNPIIA